VNGARSDPESRTVASGPPKSVLILVASNRRRGAEVFGERLTAGLSNRGWSVDFVALRSVESGRVVSASPLTTGEALRRFDVTTVLALRKRISESRPSVVLANGGATLRYAVGAGAMVSSRPMLAYASIGEPRFWLRSRGHTRIQRFLHRRADVILAVSEMTRRQLIECLEIDADGVVVAHTGVPPEFFLDRGPVHRGTHVLFLGSLSKEKDPQVAIDVLKRMRVHGPVRLRIVGDGPLASDVAHRVESEGLSEVVELIGPVEDVAPHLEWADLLVLTSKTEGLPGAIIEAAAAGVPAVAFNVGGTAETMIPGGSGFLLPPGDTHGMANALDELARDTELYDKTAQMAREFAVEHFTLERAIARYDGILSELMRDGDGQ